MKKLFQVLFLLLFVGFSKIAFGQTTAADSEKIKKYQPIIDNYTQQINNQSSIDSFNVYLYARRGGNEAILHQYDKSIADYTKVIAINPGFNGIYMSRGACYMIVKENKLALNDYEKALEYENKNDPVKLSDIYDFIGFTQKQLKQYGQSAQSFSKSIELNPNFARAYMDRGDLYAQINNYQFAVNDYTSSINLIKDDNAHLSSGFSKRANIERKLNQMKNAIGDFSRAIELNPENRLAYWNKAATYFENGDFELAIPDYTKAISLYKGDSVRQASLYDERAAMEIGLQQYQKAIEDDSMAILLNKRPWEPYLNRGQTYLKMNDKKSALNDFNMTLTLDTTKKSMEYAFALYYTGKSDKALDVMKIDFPPTPDSYLVMDHYYNLACLFSLMNKQDEANIYLKRCIDGGFGYFKRHATTDTDLNNIRNTQQYKDTLKDKASK